MQTKEKTEKELLKEIEHLKNKASEAKKISAALLQSEERWKMLYNNLPGGSFMVNREYIIEDVNDALCKVTGFNRKELVGKKCGIICPRGPDACPIFDKGRKRIDNNETAVKCKDGKKVPVLKSVRKIPFADREIVLENFLDITRQKEAETEREELIKELQEALEEVKTLGGMLPICSQCKKIRDDQGYWQQIESFIQARSDAEFSHSICPECAHKLYPEYYRDKKPSTQPKTKAAKAQKHSTKKN